MIIRIQSLRRPLRGVFKNQSRSKSFVLNSTCSIGSIGSIGNRLHNNGREYTNNAIQALPLQKNKYTINHRCYSIASTASPASGSSSSSPEDSSTSTSDSTSTKPNLTDSSSVKRTSKEEQDMELLLETTLTQAREISQIALERRNYNKVAETLSSSGLSKSPPPPPMSPPTDLIIPLHDLNNDNRIGAGSKSNEAKDQTDEPSSKNRRRKNVRNNNTNDDEIEGITNYIVKQKAHNIEQMMEIEHEAAAAGALLKLTSDPNFQHAFIQKQKQQQVEKGVFGGTDANNVVLSLHHAFLCVIHWLCNTLIQLEVPNTLGEANATTLSTSVLASASEKDLLSVLPSKESILLHHILSLIERSKALNLPLTLPLYECICTLIARHGQHGSLVDDTSNNHHSSSSSNSILSLLLLDLSILARDALLPQRSAVPVSSDNDENHSTTTSEGTEDSQFIKASFFANTLKELLQRNRFRDTIQLLHGIKNVHNLKNAVDLNTGMELLGALRDKVDFHVKSGDLNERNVECTDNDDDAAVVDDVSLQRRYDDIFNETDAMELAMILQTPVMEELIQRRRELDAYEFGGNALGNLLDEQIHNGGEYYDDDDDDKDWDDSTLYDDDDNYKFSKTDDDINVEANTNSNQTPTPFSSTDFDNKGEDESNETKNDIQKLNDLVKLMENNIHDQGAKKAAESAAVALLDKIRNNGKNLPANKNSQTTNKSSTGTQENAIEVVPTNRDIHARFHLNSSTGEIEKAEFTLNPEKTTRESHSDRSHYSMMKNMIYIRDATWEIPDVVSQLEEWNSNAGLFFSKDYETELLDEITNEHNDDNFLDETDKDDDDYGQ